MSTAGYTNDLGLRYAQGQNNGGISAWLSNTTLTISEGTFIDSTKQVNINCNSAVLNAALSGVANGLDTGSLSVSTMYYLYAIRNSLKQDSSAYLLSASSSSPTLPIGYDTFKLIGFELTNSSSQFVKKKVSGNGADRTHWWDTSISALAAGTATTLTAVSLVASVPPIANCNVILSVSYTPATAGDSVSFAPFGSTATVLPLLSGSVAAVAQKSQLEVCSALDSGVPKILYINSAAAGSATALVSGFRYSL